MSGCGWDFGFVGASFICASKQQPPLASVWIIKGIQGLLLGKLAPSSTAKNMVLDETETLPRKFNPADRRSFFSNIFQEIVTAASKQDLPRVLSPHDRHAYQQETQTQIENIRRLEVAQARIAPKVNLELEEKLFRERTMFRAFYCRVFRINDLPNEILANIFRLVVWSPPDRQAGITWRLWITWVCRRWRTVALADNTLWNVIWFHDSPPFHRSLAWFDRSGSAPLDLRVSGRDMRGTFTTNDLETLMDRLLTKLSSIRMLIIVVDSWDSIVAVLDRLCAVGRYGPPISLQRLELHDTSPIDAQVDSAHRRSTHHQPMSLFGGLPTPQLHYLSFNGVHVHWDPRTFINLTTLDIRRIPHDLSPGIAEFRHMLSTSPNLRKLCLDGAGPRMENDDLSHSPAPIVLHNLKVLIIADFSTQYARCILSHFSAPQLRDLTLIKFISEDYPSLFEMLTGRFPEVRILTTYTIAVVLKDARIMLEWLESMPHLSYLRMAHMPPTFLSLFLEDVQRRTISKQILFPNLTTLETHSPNFRELVDWAHKRREMHVPISTMYIGRGEMNFAQERVFQAQCRQLSAITTVRVLHPGTKTLEEASFLD